MKFENSNLMSVLLAAHVSEKAVGQGNGNQCVFRIAKWANKHAVKHAVEELFGKKVTAVRIVNVKGKARRFRNVMGATKGWKKAYITLAGDQQLDLSNLAA